jgi:hypothetical protein
VSAQVAAGAADIPWDLCVGSHARAMAGSRGG